AGVADATTAAVVEEHQIARFQLAAFDLRRVEADHFASRTRQLDTGFLSEQVTDKAAAIETGLDGLAAITVRRTDQGEAALEDAVGQRRQFVALLVSQFTQLLLAGLVRLRL